MQFVNYEIVVSGPFLYEYPDARYDNLLDWFYRRAILIIGCLIGHYAASGIPDVPFQGKSTTADEIRYTNFFRSLNHIHIHIRL